MRETLHEALNDALRDVRVSEARHRQMMQDITVPRKAPRRTVRIPRFAVILALLLALSATAVAAGVTVPSLFSWFSRHDRDAQLNPDVVTTELPDQSWMTFDHEGATVTVMEALADECNFMLHIMVEGGRYISADCYYRGGLNEIIWEEEDEEGRIHLMMEGMLTPDVEAPIDGVITLELRANKVTKTYDIPVEVLATLEEAYLIAPVVLGDTGYTLSYLSLTRTRLCTDVDYSWEKDVPPLEVALAEPDVRLLDAQGREVRYDWDYEDAMPIPLTVQVAAKDGTVLYERQLTEVDFTDEPVPYESAWGGKPLIALDDEQSMERTLIDWRVDHDMVPYICWPLQDQAELYKLLVEKYPRDMALYGYLPSSCIAIMKQEHVLPGEEHIPPEEAVAIAESAVTGIELTDAQQGLGCIREKDGRVIYEAAWGRPGERIVTVRIDALTGEVLSVVQ